MMKLLAGWGFRARANLASRSVRNTGKPVGLHSAQQGAVISRTDEAGDLVFSVFVPSSGRDEEAMKHRCGTAMDPGRNFMHIVPSRPGRVFALPLVIIAFEPFRIQLSDIMFPAHSQSHNGRPECCNAVVRYDALTQPRENSGCRRARMG